MMEFAFTLMVNPSGRYQYSDYPIDANSVLFLSDEKCADGHIDEKPLLFLTVRR